MKRTTQKAIKALINLGIAIELNDPAAKMKQGLHKIAVSVGACGINGAVLEDEETGQLYAIPERSTVLARYA